MKEKIVGKIDISELNTPPEKHEFETAKFFANKGFDVTFLKPSSIKGTNNPDFLLLGKIWEIKSPIGKSRRTYEDNLRKAIKQSGNIIFDLRRLDWSSEMLCINVLNKYKSLLAVKILLIIKRNGKLLTLKGNFDILYIA